MLQVWALWGMQVCCLDGPCMLCTGLSCVDLLFACLMVEVLGTQKTFISGLQTDVPILIRLCAALASLLVHWTILMHTQTDRKKKVYAEYK